MYIKDPPSNATKADNKNLEKLAFGLPQKKNLYCYVKVYKICPTQHCCNVSVNVSLQNPIPNEA